MRKLNIMLASLAAMACLALPAKAADVVTKAPPTPVPVNVTTFDWSGAYAGVTAGWGWDDAAHRHENVNPFGGPGGTYDNSGNGFTGGAFVGYNWVFPNNVMVGAEGTFRSGFNSDDGGKYKIYNNTTDTEVNFFTTVTGRVGYAFGQFLPYVKGGWAGADVESRQWYKFPGAPAHGGAGIGWNDDKFLSGYTLGAGLDYAVTPNIFVGLEYNWTDFGRKTFSANASNGVATKISSDLNDQTVLFRVGYHF